jgi:protein-tyrosine phosphatase
MLRILTLCHGNICRSPLAEVLIEAAVQADPLLAGRVEVTSAGTSPEHVGEGMHEHSAAILARRGLRTAHRARQLTTELADDQDIILAADRENLRHAQKIVATRNHRAHVCLIRDFDPDAFGLDLADPWGLPFAVYERAEQEITSAIPGILSELRDRTQGPHT